MVMANPLELKQTEIVRFILNKIKNECNHSLIGHKKYTNDFHKHIQQIVWEYDDNVAGQFTTKKHLKTDYSFQ